MNKVDWVASWILVVAALLHGVGSIIGYRTQPEVLVWALSGTLAALMVAAMNIFRRRRPGDRAIAVVSTAGAAAWAVVAVAFGAVIGNVVDPRVLVHVIAAMLLAGFGARASLSSRSAR